MRPSRGTQRLLIICGYSFGDRHVNLEINKALRESEGNLTVAAFTEMDEPTGLLKEWREDGSIRKDLLIFANRGFFHGDANEVSKGNLPWWKFENLTRILRGNV